MFFLVVFFCALCIFFVKKNIEEEDVRCWVTSHPSFSAKTVLPGKDFNFPFARTRKPHRALPRRERFFLELPGRAE